MTITIQKRREDFGEHSHFYEYTTFEIECFRWEKHHEFSYVIKDSGFWRKLKDDEELVGMKLI